jgi:hypothetical protein
MTRSEVPWRISGKARRAEVDMTIRDYQMVEDSGGIRT